MRRCRSCERCRTDARALELFGVLVKRCSLTRNPVLYPWIQGVFCNAYRKGR